MKTAQQLYEEGKVIIKKDVADGIEAFCAPPYLTGSRFQKWKNDVIIFAATLPDAHPLKERLQHNGLWRNGFVSEMEGVMGILESIIDDGCPIPNNKKQNEYDVFLSHANQDKVCFVDELNESLKKLGISIFYDKDTLEWGDNWKDRILNGTQKAEFAIIVISENFFDREWTERELHEFLSRQNQNGQKLILPILHNISIAQLQEKYPSVADIQVLNASDYTCDQIALLFAKQLIKRLKSN